MHPAGPHDTEVTKQKSYASSYSTRCKCGKVHPLSIKKVPLFDTTATLIYAESTAKLGIMFCTIAIVFTTIKDWREYTNFTQTAAYTIVYEVQCVQLLQKL